MEEVDELARRPYSVVISCYQELGLDMLLDRMWDSMALVRVYTKVKFGVIHLHSIACSNVILSTS